MSSTLRVPYSHDPFSLGITVQGSSVSLTSSSSSSSAQLAVCLVARLSSSSDVNSVQAIDTGTTLIGGPQDAVAAIYAKIPGAQAGTGALNGYYTFRTFSLSFPFYIDTQHFLFQHAAQTSISPFRSAGHIHGPSTSPILSSRRKGITTNYSALAPSSTSTPAPPQHPAAPRQVSVKATRPRTPHGSLVTPFS